MRSKNNGKDFCMFAFPGMFCFFAVVIVPFIYGIYLTLTDWNGVSKEKNFIGLRNFAGVVKDGQFWTSLLLTFKYVILVVVLVNVLAFVIAYLLTRGIKGQNFFRAGFFTPNLIGGIVLGYIWQFVFNNVLIQITSKWGMMNSILANTKTAFAAIVVVYIWQYAGYIMLIYVTGLTTVPKDVLEASQIDGANALTTLFKIKLPMIASTVTICTFLTLTSAFKQFDVNMALTNGTGSIADFMGSYLTNGTQMLALNIYNTAITKNSYALGQAKAVLFFIILACVSIIQVRISNSKEVEL